MRSICLFLTKQHNLCTFHRYLPQQRTAREQINCNRCHWNSIYSEKRTLSNKGYYHWTSCNRFRGVAGWPPAAAAHTAPSPSPRRYAAAAGSTTPLARAGPSLERAAMAAANSRICTRNRTTYGLPRHLRRRRLPVKLPSGWVGMTDRGIIGPRPVGHGRPLFSDWAVGVGLPRCLPLFRGGVVPCQLPTCPVSKKKKKAANVSLKEKKAAKCQRGASPLAPLR